MLFWIDLGVRSCAVVPGLVDATAVAWSCGLAVSEISSFRVIIWIVVLVLVEKFMVILPLSQSVILIAGDVVLLPGYPTPIGIAHLLKLFYILVLPTFLFSKLSLNEGTILPRFYKL